MPDPGANTSRRVTLPQRAGFRLGLAAFLGVRLLLDLDPDAPQVTATAAVAALIGTPRPSFSPT